MIQVWPGGTVYSSGPCLQQHSCSSDVGSITIILYWHPWGCVGAQPQLTLSLTGNQTSHKVVFLLPEMAKCGSGVQNYLRKETAAHHLLTKKYQMSLPGAGRILHIYAAKGMRAYTLAAAERMKLLRRLDAKEHRGKTPLLVAVTARQPAIVYDLIQTGADVNAVDNKGQSALHLAATYGYAQVLQVGEAFMVLIASHTPLHCAVLAHNVLAGLDFSPMSSYKIFRLFCRTFLILFGFSSTVLHYTVQDGNISLLRYFLELNAFKSKDFVNNKAHGNTALHMAAALPRDKNQKEIIQLLLDHGADPSIRNLDNDQPIHMAPSGKVRHLLKKGKAASAFVSCRRNARS
uniref:Uncharacterized protein n=1 Tax=Bubo bubo TaxID=30461 RepID=A0A8C0F191_BUBBB